jgi:hypothetical protein
MAYPALISSVAAVVARERTVRWTLVLGATGFAAFTMFWTALTFLISAQPFNYQICRRPCAASRGEAANGWTFWRNEISGETLGAVRDRFRPPDRRIAPGSNAATSRSRSTLVSRGWSPP